MSNFNYLFPPLETGCVGLTLAYQWVNANRTLIYICTSSRTILTTKCVVGRNNVYWIFTSNMVIVHKRTNKIKNKFEYRERSSPTALYRNKSIEKNGYFCECMPKSLKLRWKHWYLAGFLFREHAKRALV